MRQDEISLQTKTALAEALKEEMRTKPFQKITVSDLVRRCNVNRKTFYYHFQDIYDLLEWLFEREAIEVVKQFDLMVDYEEAVCFVMDYIQENEYMISCAYDSIGRDVLKSFFYSDFRDITMSLIREMEEQTGKTLEDGYREFICSFYIEGLAGMIVNWVCEPSKWSRDDAASYIVAVIRDSLLGILNGKVP